MVRVFNHFFPVTTLLRVLVDFGLLFAALVLAVALQAPEWLSLKDTVLPALIFAVAMTLIMSLVGLYETPRSGEFARVVGRALIVFLLVLPISYALVMLAPDSHQLMEVVNVTAVLGLGGVLVLRAAALAKGSDVGMFSKRILVMGVGQDALTIAEAVRDCEPNYQVVGFLPSASEEVFCVPQSSTLCRSTSLREWVDRLGVSEVVVAVRERRGGALPLRELLDCKLDGVKVTDQVSFLERVRGQVHLDSLKASWLIYGDGFRQGVGRMFVKRLFDLLASLILLSVAAPIMLITAIVIMLDSPGAVIYRQERVGQNGRTFNVLKFRSMRCDAEADGKPRWAGHNDSRVTAIGKFIRKTRIDELPQLLNVIRGDMSFVGPRPERPYFVDQLTQQIPFYAGRHSVKPGITGWAQVKYPYGASFDDAVGKLQYDLYYVKNHTVFLDLMILFQTVRVVLTGQGAR